jgi:hypothetical protein
LIWPKIICNDSKARKITLTDFWKFTWISIKNAFQLLGEKIYFQEKQLNWLSAYFGILSWHWCMCIRWVREYVWYLSKLQKTNIVI